MKRLLAWVCILGVSVSMVHLGATPAEASHNQAKRIGCQEYGKVKWTSWNDFAYLYFTNRTKSDVVISYIDFGGKKRQWSRQPIKPGRAFYTGTFLTLPWIVETTAGKCVGIYEATKANRLSWATVIKAEGTGIKHACATRKNLGHKVKWDLLKVEFTNQTSKKLGLYIVWKGERWPKKKPYAEIPAGATYKVFSYSGLPWMVVDEKDQCVEIWEADASLNRITLKPKPGGPPKPRAEGVPMGYLHYKEQQAFISGVDLIARPNPPAVPLGELVHLGVCVASNAQRSIPGGIMLPHGSRALPFYSKVYGVNTKIAGQVLAVRHGGDFDCADMEKDWGRYTSPKGKKIIVPGTAKKLTLVVDVDTDSSGKVEPDVTKQAHAGELNAEHPAFNPWNLKSATVTHQPYEILDFSGTAPAPSPGKGKLPVAPPGSEGDANGYVSCASMVGASLQPYDYVPGCGIGVIVKAVNSFESYHYDDKTKKRVPRRGLGYKPEDNIKGRAFYDRLDDPANQVKDAFRIHAIYVLPADFKDYQLDLSSSKGGGIPAALKYANEVVKLQSQGVRRPPDQTPHEFRLDVIRGTDTPDVSFLRLGLTDKEVFSGVNSPFSGKQDKEQTAWFNILAKAVNAAGFNHPRKMYAIFYPGNSDVGGVASNANVGITTWVHGSKAPQDVVSKWGARVYLHELFHNLGQVVDCGPDDDGGAHSKVKGDVMKDAGTDIDVARTTYYDHDNSCIPDLAKSIFLTPSPKPTAQLPPSWSLNQHCIYRNLWAGNAKACSKMSASDYNTSGTVRAGAGEGSGSGSVRSSSQSGGGQINAEQAGITEMRDQPGIDWHNHTSYWDKQPSGAGTKGSGASTSSQVPADERVPM